MSLQCPKCGTEFDVTLFSFDRPIRCDCGEWVSMNAGSSFVNLIARPTTQRWSWWGRVIFYVSDVDAMHRRVIENGLRPDTSPRDAEWGERFFHITDAEGHELSFAAPLPDVG